MLRSQEEGGAAAWKHPAADARSLKVSRARRPGAFARWLGCSLMLASTAAVAQPGDAAAAYPVPMEQGGPAHTMTDAVEAAVAYHPSIRTAVENWRAAASDIDVARAGYYPQVSLSGGNRLGRVDSSSSSDEYGRVVTLSATQMLYDFGKVSSSVSRAQAQQAVARAKVLAAVDQVALDTAKAWIEVRRYTALLEISRAQTAGVTAIAKLASQRQALGASSLSDRLQADARVEAARAEELSTGAQLERWVSQLQQLTGRPGPLAVGGEVPAATETACAAATAGLPVPSVLVAQAQLLSARADADYAVAQDRPTISLQGTLSRYAHVGPAFGDPHQSQVMVNVTAPLYQGGAGRARERAAEQALAAARNTVADAELSVRQDLQDAQAQAQGYARRIEVLDRQVQSIEHTRDLYRQQYLDLGTRTLLDLLNAEQEYQQSRESRVDNQNDLQRMQMQCLFDTGRMREVLGLQGLPYADVEFKP